LSVVRSLFGGRARYIVSDPASGRHLSVSPEAYQLLASLDGKRPLEAAARQAGLAPEAAERMVQRLATAGLVTAPQLPPPVAPVQPLEGRALFLRRELVELTPVMPLANRLMGWLFTRWAVALWLIAGLGALLLLSTDDRQSGLLDWLGQMDGAQLLLLYAIFLVLKLLHELGHAVALWRAASEEGLPIRSIRAGIAVMLILPFPFTNVSSAWRLQSKWKRARIGVAGMYVELCIAILAVFAWGLLEDPVAQSLAIQVATVAAVTTLLFNLNPFGRMDGYYVLGDLLEIPNLLQRGSAAAIQVPAHLFRVRPAASLPPLDWRLLGYWAGTAAYRLLVFAGLVWLAHSIAPWLAFVMLAVAVSLLVVRPSLATARALLAMAEDKPRTARRLALFAALSIGALALVPVPAGIKAYGVVEAPDARFVYPPVDARVEFVRPVNSTASGPALRLHSPELDEMQQKAELESARALARWRDAIDLGLPGAQSAAEQLAAHQSEAESRLSDRALLRVDDATGWDPLDAEAYAGSWVRPNPARPLAVSLPSPTRRIHAVFDNSSAETLAPGQTARVRIAGRPDQAFTATVLRVAEGQGSQLPSPALGRPAGGPFAVEPGDSTGRQATRSLVSVWLAPEQGAPALRHGQRVDLRIGAPPRPLLWQAAVAAMRLLDPDPE
jgi:putative peptide zinc metalloprotease protein